MYTFLRNFPENTYALPQIFRKVVKGLNSSHWLAKKVDELKNRRWRIHNTVREFGRLSDEEVHKIREANPAFWECFMQKQPPAEVLQKKQMQYDRKTANVKQARTGRPQDSAGKRDVPRSPKLSKKTRIVNRAAAAANRVHTSPSGYTELIDPTAVDALEEIVQNNPVLSKIRECGVKAKREDVYPTSVSCLVLFAKSGDEMLGQPAAYLIVLFCLFACFYLPTYLPSRHSKPKPTSTRT